jgi:hypothetical protein
MIRDDSKRRCCLFMTAFILSCSQTLIRCADGLILGRTNLQKLWRPSRKAPISCLLYGRYYGDSDEDLFDALLADKSKSLSRDTATTVPIISRDNTSLQYPIHLENVTAPSPLIKPEEIVPLIMNALRNNDVPEKDAGLRLIWEFATDSTHYVFTHNITGE